MNNEELLLFKNKFLAWAVKCTIAANDSTEEIQFGLPDIVNILRALGFQIRDIDGCDPQDITALKNGKRGMRIILTCLYSGQRYYLEKSIEKESVIESLDNTACSSKHSKPYESSEEKTSVKDDICGGSSEKLTSRERCKDELKRKDEPLAEIYKSVKKVDSDLGIASSRLEKVSLSKFGKAAPSTPYPNFHRQHSQRQSKSIKPSTSQNPQLSTRTRSSPNLYKNRTYLCESSKIKTFICKNT